MAESEKKKEEKRKNKKNRHHHRKKYSRKLLYGTAAVCLGTAAILGVLFYQAQEQQKKLQIRADNSHDTGSGYRDIVAEGKHYRYNSLITTILYAGVDSTGKMEETLQYGNKARADVISLVVLDKKHGKLTLIPVSRDTMTEVRRYSMNGNDNGLYTTHLGYAYSYGDGGKVSCENLCEAVSLLFGGIPIREYVVTNQDSMPYLNGLVDGITLTMPNGDLEDQYPEFAEGAQVTLDEENVRTFLQYRDTEEDFSNEGRMERQKAYATAYIEKVRQMDSTDMEDAWGDLENMEDYLQTSITRNQYLDLADLVKNTEFSEESFITIEGEDQMGELHDEFYPDREALEKLILETFYDEV